MLAPSNPLLRRIVGSAVTRRLPTLPQPFQFGLCSAYRQGLRQCSSSTIHTAQKPSREAYSLLAHPPRTTPAAASSQATRPPTDTVDNNNDNNTMPDRSWTSKRVAPTPEELLETNQKWLADADPEMFATNAKGQSPSIFWLGCCDSRVPAELITGAAPGDLFVHRNIANTFSNKDNSALAALAYAVNNLGVSHVIVCGHQSCGGIQAALASAKERVAASGAVDEGTEAIQNWLTPIRALAVANLRTSSTFAAEADPAKTLRTLVEQNVCAQVSNVASSSVVKNAWRQGRTLTVHGWVYDIANGKIEDLKVSEGSAISNEDE